MLLAVWVVFVVCWSPFMVAIICDAFGVDLLEWTMQDHSLMMRALTCLAYSNSCLNPFLYAFLSSYVYCIFYVFTQISSKFKHITHIFARSKHNYIFIINQLYIHICVFSRHFRRGFVNCFLACCGGQMLYVDRMGLSSSVKTRMTVMNKHQDTSIAFSKTDLSNSEHSNASN